MVATEVLKKLSLFAGLDNAEVECLSAIATEVSFQAGDLIFREEDSAEALYLLLQGWVDIIIDTRTRSCWSGVVMTLTCDDVFGWSAVIEPYIYTTSALCASPVKAVKLKGSDLRDLFEFDPKLCSTILIRICQMMVRQLRATRLQMMNLFSNR